MQRDGRAPRNVQHGLGVQEGKLKLEKLTTERSHSEVHSAFGTVSEIEFLRLTLPGLAPTPGRISISGPSERSEAPGRRSPGGGSREGGRA
eukprot:2719866-Pyramimonas_sp.AAC.1